MPTRKKPAMHGHGGLSENVCSLAAQQTEDSPNSHEFQYVAPKRLTEARDLPGAARFAAEALGAHFAARAVVGGAHG